MGILYKTLAFSFILSCSPGDKNQDLPKDFDQVPIAKIESVLNEKDYACRPFKFMRVEFQKQDKLGLIFKATGFCKGKSYLVVLDRASNKMLDMKKI